MKGDQRHQYTSNVTWVDSAVFGIQTLQSALVPSHSTTRQPFTWGYGPKIQMLPPTSQLPPIKYINTHPIDALESALHFLRLIYNPNVRGSRRRRKSSKPPGHSHHASEELLNFQSDPFERSYAIKWLTALITQCGTVEEEEEAEVGTKCSNTARTKQDLVEEAAAILAMCAGTASAGVITRQFVFDRGWEAEDASIAVELTDVPLDNQDYGSVGAQTWGGACIMAEMIVENPLAFGLGATGLFWELILH